MGFRTGVDNVNGGADTIAQLTTWFASYGPPLFFVLLALENVVFTSMIVPGLFVVIFGGYYAGVGGIPAQVPLLLCIAGLWTGDLTNYTLGRLFWGRLVRRTRIERLVERVRPALQARSSWFFVIYHFEPMSRMVGALAAGVVRVPVRRWLPFDFLGGAIWVTFYWTIGFLIGRFGGNLGEWATLPPIEAIALVLITAWLLVITLAVRRSLRLPEPKTGADEDEKPGPADG